MTCKAYVINTDSGELSQWLEIGFSRLWMLNGTPYLVRADGVYKMDGALELPETPLSLQLASSRLDSDQLKRLLYVMADGEGAMEFTPLYDTVVGNSVTGDIGDGTRFKVGRGNKSRWLAAQITSTDRKFVLAGLRLYYDILSRKVL